MILEKEAHLKQARRNKKIKRSAKDSERMPHSKNSVMNYPVDMHYAECNLARLQDATFKWVLNIVI